MSGSLTCNGRASRRTAAAAVRAISLFCLPSRTFSRNVVSTLQARRVALSRHRRFPGCYKAAVSADFVSFEGLRMMHLAGPISPFKPVDYSAPLLVAPKPDSVKTCRAVYTFLVKQAQRPWLSRRGRRSDSRDMDLVTARKKTTTVSKLQFVSLYQITAKTMSLSVA